MVRLCSGLTKVASCFCLNSKGKSDRKSDGNEADLEPNPDMGRTTSQSRNVTVSNHETFPEEQDIVDSPRQPRSPSNPASSNGLEGSTDINENVDQSQTDNFKVDWTSGGRKETISISWRVKDFLSLCDLKELLRNETLVFTAGLSINAPTRWCFNLQKMKNENNIGLFLKRLKPLSLNEDEEDYQNRNRNPVPGVIVPTPQGVGVLNVQAAPTATAGTRHASAYSVEDDENEGDDAVYIHYEVLIKRSGFGDVWLHKRTCIPNFEVGQRLGFRKLFTIEDLKEADVQPQPTPSSPAPSKLVPLLGEDGTLHLEMKFNLHLQSNGKTKSEINLLENMVQENNERFHHHLLSSELGHLLESGINSDIILIMEEDDKTFSVHKGILSARSAVFAAMFHSGMKESRTGVVRIKDVTSRAMENVLCYAYTGSTDIGMNWSDVQGVQDLIYAADKYSLKGMKDLIEHMMCTGCKKDNALELLYLAQAHNLNFAVKKISLFIKKHVDDVLCPNLTTSKVTGSVCHQQRLPGRN